MQSIDSRQALAVLTGSEGALDNRIPLIAVPDSQLGRAGGGYASGFAFGHVQLDIGNNTHAKAAYKEILELGVARGVITKEQSEELAKYAVQRPDVKYPEDYKAARALLNATVFNPDSPMAKDVNAIIAKHQQKHLETAVVPTVNAFLQAHTTSVFNPTHPDYATAVSSLISSANRSGGLSRYTAALDGNANPTLADAKKGWQRQIGEGVQAGDWSLVQRGAKAFTASGQLPEHSNASQPLRPDEDALRGSPLFKNALAQLKAYNAEHGIPSDERTVHAAGAIAAAAAAKGMTKIDHMEPSTDGTKLIAVQGQPGTANSKIVSIPTVPALDTPFSQSAQMFAQAVPQLERNPAQPPAQQQPNAVSAIAH